MTVTNTGRRFALVGVLALMLALVPLSASALTGTIALDYEINPDIDASDAVQTSVLVSQNFDAAENVLIATSEDFADALASGSLQGSDSPLFYTDGDTVDQIIFDEIDRLGATSATILGGTAAVSEDVETALTDEELEVDRLEGGTRIETAIAIAGATLADDADNILLARAFGADDGSDPTQAFADSLAAGGWSADTGTPILLTETDVLTGNTSDYLASLEGVSTVTIVGGEAAVSAEVATQVEELGFTVERVGGANRFGTAVEIATARGFASADEADTVIFAEGQSDTAFIDGFAAASLSAAIDAPIVLTNGENVPPETQAWIGDAGTFEQIDIDPDAIAAHLLPQVENEEGLAEALGLDLEVHMLEGDTPVDDSEGTIVGFNNANDTYAFVPFGGDTVVEVTYDTADDEFLVDGEAATSGVFELALSVGDEIEVDAPAEGSEDPTLHSLTNREASDYTSGTVGNVDILSTQYDIIEPVSGVPLRTDVDYGGELLTVDGSAATQTTFEGDINEGDSISIDQDEAGITEGHNLMNESVSGSVSAIGAETANDIELQISNLGDDPADAVNDDYFVADDTDNLFVDGEEVETADFTADFADQVSVGDDITYTREGGEETYQLGNLAPPTRSGLATEDITSGLEFFFLPEGSDTRESCVYADAGDAFLVDGVLGTEGDFENAYTPGDIVTCRDADPDGTGQGGRITLENADLTGFALDGVANDDLVEVYRDADLSDDGIAVPVDFRNPAFAGGTQLYVVDGTPSTDVQFEDALADLDSDDDPTLTVAWGPVSNTWTLDTES